MPSERASDCPPDIVAMRACDGPLNIAAMRAPWMPSVKVLQSGLAVVQSIWPSWSAMEYKSFSAAVHSRV